MWALGLKGGLKAVTLKDVTKLDQEDELVGFELQLVYESREYSVIANIFDSYVLTTTESNS